MHRLLVTIPHLGEGEFLQRDEDTRNKEKREREIRELSQGKRLIHEKCGSMRVKKLFFETISTKETQTLIPVNSDDRGQCWGMYNTPYLGAGQQKGKQLPLMYN